jgi:hypothetical protein
MHTRQSKALLPKLTSYFVEWAHPELIRYFRKNHFRTAKQQVTHGVCTLREVTSQFMEPSYSAD